MEYKIINDLTIKKINIELYFGYFSLISIIGMLFSFGCAFTRLYWRYTHLNDLLAQHKYFEYHQTIDLMKDSNFIFMSFIFIIVTIISIAIMNFEIRVLNKYKNALTLVNLDHLETKVLRVKQKGKYIYKYKGKIYLEIQGLDDSISFRRCLSVPEDIYQKIDKENFVIQGKEFIYKNKPLLLYPEVYLEGDYI